jgi:hypothetical protein
VSHCVESQAVESVTTAVESDAVPSSEEDPQETRKDTTANIKNSFFIIIYFFNFFTFLYMESVKQCFGKTGFFMKKN